MLITWLAIAVMFGVAELLTWRWWFLPTCLGSLTAAVISLLTGSLLLVALGGLTVAIGTSIFASSWSQKHRKCAKETEAAKAEATHFEPNYAWVF